MKITIEGTPKEVKEWLQATNNGLEPKEQVLDLNVKGILSPLDLERTEESILHARRYHTSEASIDYEASTGHGQIIPQKK